MPARSRRSGCGQTADVVTAVSRNEQAARLVRARRLRAAEHVNSSRSIGTAGHSLRAALGVGCLCSALRAPGARAWSEEVRCAELGES